MSILVDPRKSRGSFKTFCPLTPMLPPDQLEKEIERLEQLADGLPEPAAKRILRRVKRYRKALRKGS